MKVTYKNLKLSMKVDNIETAVSIEEAEIEVSCFDIKEIIAGIKDIAKLGVDVQFNKKEPNKEEDYPDIPF